MYERKISTVWKAKAWWIFWAMMGKDQDLFSNARIVDLTDNTVISLETEKHVFLGKSFLWSLSEISVTKHEKNPHQRVALWVAATCRFLQKLQQHAGMFVTLFWNRSFFYNKQNPQPFQVLTPKYVCNCEEKFGENKMATRRETKEPDVSRHFFAVRAMGNQRKQSFCWLGRQQVPSHKSCSVWMSIPCTSVAQW